ncbi:hypothetical protein [Dactylosporangium fulvum]|uniref:Uncharacterized protein n=1 Tax=Dactylosporangium fulvum TaxID=53359 RepID=A0ABY5WDA7_9ACTN|nr:hypothetical protein [Dactylosporangium fulvum]UWP86261.1 hypothetical protein Dfulv_19265 [Dactylosporangium fulvum]
MLHLRVISPLELTEKPDALSWVVGFFAGVRTLLVQRWWWRRRV